jgi:hypothetical protein
MYLSQYEKTNKIIVNLAKNVIKQHSNWNTLILFDYTASGESLFSLLDWENKHYIDGQVKLETRTDIVDKMNDPNGRTNYYCKLQMLWYRYYCKKYSMYYFSNKPIFSN